MSEIRSHEIRLAISAVSIGIVLGSGICYILMQNLKQDISRKEKGKQSTAIQGGNNNEYPSEIKSELSSRVRTFFGDKGFSKLENSFIVVVGLGGVGSHCANMLVRSGVGRIRLIDFDQVSLSSLNRHALAELGDVGISKVEAMRRHLQNIVPWCIVETFQEMFNMDDAHRLLLQSTQNSTIDRPDFVIDCIDDVITKAELIVFCLQNGLEVITSMGAGGKSDPTRLRISSLSDCINDPLAAKIKWKLKKHGVSAEDVMSLFSVEKPVCDLLPLSQEQQANPQDYGAVDYLRIRVMPVLGTTPSIFGQSLASYVLCKLADKMYSPETCERMSKNLKHKIRQLFKNNEIKRFQSDKEIDLDDEDIEFIVQQMWGSRCAVTNRRFGGHLTLTLTRWDPNHAPTAANLVLMMQDQAEKLLVLKDSREALFGEAVVERIETRLRWAKQLLG